jgi:hypothetical protein
MIDLAAVAPFDDGRLHPTRAVHLLALVATSVHPSRETGATRAGGPRQTIWRVRNCMKTCEYVWNGARPRGQAAPVERVWRQATR